MKTPHPVNQATADPAAYDAFCQRLFRQNELAVKLGLERMRSALDSEGVPDRRFPTIIVAGTNGKGSVASLLNAAFIGAGMRTGLFTSPHLIDVRERIRVDGEPIDRSTFLTLGTQMLDRWSDTLPPEARLTYFELVTLLAVVYFAARRVDVAIMEVGLGGRLDATNALSPDLSVVTQVSRDHEAYLGTDLADILREKLGVLRRGVPAVIARSPGLDTAHISATLLDLGLGDLGFRDLEVADSDRGTDLGVKHWVEGRDFGRDGLTATIGRNETCDLDWVPFAGDHQVDNALYALAALAQIRRMGWELPTPSDLIESMRCARWPGRWMSATWRERLIYVDGAHNAAATVALARTMNERLKGPVTMVFGVVLGKPVHAMAASLAPQCRRVFVCPVTTPRSACPEAVAACFRSVRGESVEVTEVGSLAEGLESALEFGDPIVVAGSLYLVGEALELSGYTPETLHVFERLKPVESS